MLYWKLTLGKAEYWVVDKGEGSSLKISLKISLNISLNPWPFKREALMFSSDQDCVINREMDVVIPSRQELNALKVANMF